MKWPRATWVVTVLLSATVRLSTPCTYAQEVAVRPVDDPEAYAVYAAVLPTEWVVKSAHAKKVVLRKETGTNPRCLPTGTPVETDWKPVIDNYRIENAAARSLQAEFDVGVPYAVVTDNEIKASFTDARNDPNLGWGGFYKRFPDSGGFVVASAVGFDSAKRRAMVYVTHSCGSLCGGGTYYLLERVESVWQLVQVPGLRNCLWVS